MRFPYPNNWNNANCVVSIKSNQPNEDGEFSVLQTYSGPCNLSEKSVTIRSTDGEFVRLSCVVHIQGDIAPNYDTFTGSVTINSREMLIETIDRPRNPDGTVHHTRLGLI